MYLCSVANINLKKDNSIVDVFLNLTDRDLFLIKKITVKLFISVWAINSSYLYFFLFSPPLLSCIF